MSSATLKLQPHYLPLIFLFVFTALCCRLNFLRTFLCLSHFKCQQASIYIIGFSLLFLFNLLYTSLNMKRFLFLWTVRNKTKQKPFKTINHSALFRNIWLCLVQSFTLRQDFGSKFNFNQLYYAWDKMQDILWLFFILMSLISNYM